MTSFLETGEAYSYSKQGTEVICGSDLTTRSEKPGSNPDLHSADLQTLPPPNKNSHHRFLREKAGIIWREHLSFVNGHFCRRGSKVKTWALVGQCPGVRHQATHKIWHSDGFKIGQDNMLSKRTPTLSGSNYLAHQFALMSTRNNTPTCQGKAS